VVDADRRATRILLRPRFELLLELLRDGAEVFLHEALDYDCHGSLAAPLEKWNVF
jgi:hypothetical protein